MVNLYRFNLKIKVFASDRRSVTFQQVSLKLNDNSSVVSYKSKTLMVVDLI